MEAERNRRHLGAHRPQAQVPGTSLLRVMGAHYDSDLKSLFAKTPLTKASG
jgi:hypothetical protein